MVLPMFRVRLRGRNFLLADGDVVERRMFHVTVFVRGRDIDGAREAAVAALAADEDLLAALRNPPHDPPALFTLEATLVPPELAPPEKRSAFEFAPDDGSEPEPG